jgi:dipeptidyl aminopeptidase/acylaminoacyl peptidase
MNIHAPTVASHRHQDVTVHAHSHEHGLAEGHLTLESVLALKYPHSLAYSPTGDGLAWLWNDAGACNLWRRGPDGRPEQVSSGGKVSSFSWSRSGQLAWVDDGRLVVGGMEAGVGGARLSTIAWSPAGDWLAGIGGSSEVLLWSARHGHSSIAIDVPPGLINPGPVVPLRWSPDGLRLAVTTRAEGVRGLLVLDVDAAAIAWRHEGDGYVTAFAWLDPGHLHLTLDMPPEKRRHAIVDVASAAVETALTETGLEVIAGAGAHACPVPPVVSPDGRSILYTLYRDGWAHLFSLDVATRALTQLTHGSFDDSAGDRFHSPCWVEGGAAIVYPSSRGDLKQRQLFRYGVADGAISQVTILPGTNHAPIASAVTGELAFVHCGPAESPDIWVLDRGAVVPRQLTMSMPAVWSDQTAVVPIHVEFPSADGTRIHGDLFLPAEFDPSRKYPVLVFVHGGTIDQMRFGWPPGSPYLGIYGWHQYLCHHGFAVLSLDYRGTSGYGLDYQAALWGRMGLMDVDDCVAAAAWLGEQSWAAHDRIGIWGISYGGYLTLAALTKSPGTFAAGICVAGVWDWDRVREQRAAADVCLAETGLHRMTAGHVTAEEIAEAHRQASPSHFVDQLADPLLVLHGTGDARVTSDQMDTLISDCVRHGKRIEVMYYPNESHVFTKRETWRDAYWRMQDFLERRLVGHQTSCC